MTLRTETGLQAILEEWWFKLKLNWHLGSIRDIDACIEILSKNNFWQKLHLVIMNTSYTAEENIEILKLLKNQKIEYILMMKKHLKQIHELNVKFNNNRGVWNGDPHQKRIKQLTEG